MRQLDYGEVADVMESLPASVGVALRLFGISQRELARQAGVSAATISRLVNGRDVTAASVVAVLRALNELATRP